MICRTLGRTGIKVRAIALGCEGFSAKSHEEARGMMNFAGANDIHFIDVRASDPEMRSTIGTVHAKNALRSAFPCAKK